MKCKSNVSVGLGGGWYLRSDLRQWILRHTGRRVTWYYSDLSVLLNDYLMVRLRTSDVPISSVVAMLECLKSLVVEVNEAIKPLNVISEHLLNSRTRTSIPQETEVDDLR